MTMPKRTITDRAMKFTTIHCIPVSALTLVAPKNIKTLIFSWTIHFKKSGKTLLDYCNALWSNMTAHLDFNRIKRTHITLMFVLLALNTLLPQISPCNDQQKMYSNSFITNLHLIFCFQWPFLQVVIAHH